MRASSGSGSSGCPSSASSSRRRRFVLPATAFFLVWYFGFIVLAGYAEDFMGTSLIDGFTVGYGLALTQFVMVAVLGLSYLRYSERHLDPLRVRIADVAGALEPTEAAVAADPNAVHSGRFDRPPPETATATAPSGPGGRGSEQEARR